MKERLDDGTECPRCEEELDDDDGCFFDHFSGIKKCKYCQLEITFVKQMKRDYENTYCDYVWHETYMSWEDN